MAKISVGFTTSGKAILVSSRRSEANDLSTDFGTFSERDSFDALLGLDYLSLCECRKSHIDTEWVDSINEAREYLRSCLAQDIINTWKAMLHIESAFAARDYGKTMIHKHFRLF